MKLALRLFGIGGTLAFGMFLALSFASPIYVERAARGFIQSQIERQLSAELGNAAASARETRIGSLAGALAAQHKIELAALRARLGTDLNAQIAAAVGRMQDLSCECRERLRQGLDAAAVSRISTLERAEPQLRRIIEGKYGAIVADLLRDLRIFAGTNLLAFALLLVLSILKPSGIRQLFVPATLLGVAAVTTSLFYLFGQNWFFTLLYADFFGWTYGLWLLLVFGLFCDVALFKARITTWVVNALLAALSKAPIPC